MVRNHSQFAKISRLPLSLVPRDMPVPIMDGGLRGTRWIAGSAIHRRWLEFYKLEKQRLMSQEVRRGDGFWDVEHDSAERLYGGGDAGEPDPRFGRSEDHRDQEHAPQRDSAREDRVFHIDCR